MKKLLFAALLLALPLFADHDEYERHFPQDFSYLHLNPAQRQALKDALLRYQRRIEAIHKQEEQLEKKMERLFLSENFDKEAYVELGCSFQRRILEAQADFYAALHRILSPKQRRLFLESFKEWEIE